MRLFDERVSSMDVEIILQSSGIFWRSLGYAQLILVVMFLKFPCFPSVSLLFSAVSNYSNQVMYIKSLFLLTEKKRIEKKN